MWLILHYDDCALELELLADRAHRIDANKFVKLFRLNASVLFLFLNSNARTNGCRFQLAIHARWTQLIPRKDWENVEECLACISSHIQLSRQKIWLLVNCSERNRTESSSTCNCPQFYSQTPKPIQHRKNGAKFNFPPPLSGTTSIHPIHHTLGYEQIDCYYLRIEFRFSQQSVSEVCFHYLLRTLDVSRPRNPSTRYSNGN